MQVGDLRHFDVFKGYAQLRAAAERLTGGNVVPTTANWSGVGRDGSIDVTAGGYARYWYVMTGAMRDEARCLFGVELRNGTAIGMIGTGNCAQKPMLAPECTITQLRDKAIKAGMPESAERLHLNRIGRTWAVTVEGGGKDAWSEQIRDDCAGD